jgi:addiction module HigA family antidote
MPRIPKNRRPATPGHILATQYLTPLNVTVTDFAGRIGVTRARLSEIIHGRRGITPDTALRLARVLNTSPDLWLNLQQNVDLFDAVHSSNAAVIERLAPLVSARSRGIALRS